MKGILRNSFPSGRKHNSNFLVSDIKTDETSSILHAVTNFRNLFC
jgi:hypothetical protein